jgi:hypothetical protein
MINDEAVDHYNSRLTVDLGNLKNLTVSQLDGVRHYGSQAESLLKNRDLAMFIHHFKFSQADALSGIRGHTPDDNSQRVAISNELAGIDNFVSSLKRAVYLKNRIGNTNTVPNDNT